MTPTSEKIKIHFWGASGTVTGSKYLVETAEKRILIDCGLFQGLKALRLLNRQPLPVDAGSIDFVLLTHGHLDHTGYLPLLVKQGFKGPVYATEPTIAITRLILEDSAKIQEEDAFRANRDRYSRHTPALPLYNTKEAEAVFPLFVARPLSKWIDIDNSTSFRFRYNGHILGACFVELKIAGKLLVFSGDIGRQEDPLLRDPETPGQADVVFIESTYGNRLHPANVKQLLANEINAASVRNGTIVIPGFAVERAQLIMYLLWQLKNENRIPPVPVYLDSPMGAHVIGIFGQYPAWHKLSGEETREMLREIKVVRNEEETYALLNTAGSKIIISSSGMATGGRVLSYFERYLGDPAATILLAGYQGEGTRGRALLEGAKEIKMRGKYYPVRAHISMIEGLSAHADQGGLIRWLSGLRAEPSRLFVTHGETEASHALSEKIKEIYNWNTAIPKLQQVTEI